MAKEDLLHELALRLLKVQNRRGANDEGTLDLRVGELPPNLPVNIPIKTEWRVLGSLQQVRMGGYTTWTIILDAPENPEAIKQQLVTGLTGQGWKESSIFERMMPSHGGFMHQGFPSLDPWKHIGRQRQRDPHAPIELAKESEPFSGSLYLHASRQRRDSTAVSLVITNQYSTHLPRMENKAPSGVTLPDLTAPEGIAVIPGGSSYGGVHAQSHAQANTKLSVADLEAHYARQLEEAGWERVDGGAESRFAWSTWHISAEPESEGYLYVLQGMKPNSRILNIEIKATLGGGHFPTLLDDSFFSLFEAPGLDDGEGENSGPNEQEHP